MRSCHTSRSTSRSSGDWCRALETALGVVGAGDPYWHGLLFCHTCSKSHFLFQPDFVDWRPEPWRRCGEVQAARVSLRVPAPVLCSCPQLRASVLDLRLTGNALGDLPTSWSPWLCGHFIGCIGSHCLGSQRRCVNNAGNTWCP